eukprot:12385460-Heterocapsa_arctica.AAC.1
MAMAAALAEPERLATPSPSAASGQQLDGRHDLAECRIGPRMGERWTEPAPHRPEENITLTPGPAGDEEQRGGDEFPRSPLVPTVETVSGLAPPLARAMRRRPRRAAWRCTAQVLRDHDARHACAVGPAGHVRARSADAHP